MSLCACSGCMWLKYVSMTEFVYEFWCLCDWEYWVWKSYLGYLRWAYFCDSLLWVNVCVCACSCGRLWLFLCVSLCLWLNAYLCDFFPLWLSRCVTEYVCAWACVCSWLRRTDLEWVTKCVGMAMGCWGGWQIGAWLSTMSVYATKGVCDSVFVCCSMCLWLSAYHRACVCGHEWVGVCVWVYVFLSMSAPVEVCVWMNALVTELMCA